MDFLDRDQLSAMAGGYPEMLLPILDDFHQKARHNLGDLQGALAGGQLEDARGLFHQLKGSSGSLGLRPLHQLCAHFEATAKAGGAIEPTVPGQLEKLLEDSVAAAREFLASGAKA